MISKRSYIEALLNDSGSDNYDSDTKFRKFTKNIHQDKKDAICCFLQHIGEETPASQQIGCKRRRSTICKSENKTRYECSPCNHPICLRHCSILCPKYTF